MWPQSRTQGCLVCTKFLALGIGQFGTGEPCWAVLGMAGLAPYSRLYPVVPGYTFLPRYSIPSCLQMLPSVPVQMALGESQQSLPPTAFCHRGGGDTCLCGARTQTGTCHRPHVPSDTLWFAPETGMCPSVHHRPQNPLLLACTDSLRVELRGNERVFILHLYQS